MLRSVSSRAVGLAIVILALWGGLIPFVGPYFHFTLGSDRVWTWTAGRAYLSVLPAIGALIGGLWLMGAGPWASGRVGALLALLSGVWFAVGPELSPLWHAAGQVGAAHGSATVQALERLGMHSGLGVVIAGLAAFALPWAVGRRQRAGTVPTAAAPTATAVTNGGTAVRGGPLRTPDGGPTHEPVPSS